MSPLVIRNYHIPLLHVNPFQNFPLNKTKVTPHALIFMKQWMKRIGAKARRKWIWRPLVVHMTTA